MYWSAFGPGVSETARKLCDRRDATIIPNRTADAFFRDLAEKVEALEDFEEPTPAHPGDRRGLDQALPARERHRIRLDDLVMQELGRVLAELSSERFPFVASRSTRSLSADACSNTMPSSRRSRRC